MELFSNGSITEFLKKFFLFIFIFFIFKSEVGYSIFCFDFSHTSHFALDLQ